MCRLEYNKAAAFSEKSDQQTADNPLSRSRWFGKEEKCLESEKKNLLAISCRTAAIDFSTCW